MGSFPHTPKSYVSKMFGCLKKATAQSLYAKEVKVQMCGGVPTLHQAGVQEMQQGWKGQVEPWRQQHGCASAGMVSTHCLMSILVNAMYINY